MKLVYEPQRDESCVSNARNAVKPNKSIVRSGREVGKMADRNLVRKPVCYCKAELNRTFNPNYLYLNKHTGQDNADSRPVTVQTSLSSYILLHILNIYFVASCKRELDMDNFVTKHPRVCTPEDACIGPLRQLLAQQEV